MWDIENPLSSLIENPNDPRLKGRFLLTKFDGHPTITHGIADELLHTFLEQKKEMVFQIEEKLQLAKVDYPEDSSLVFKIGVYNKEVLLEEKLFPYDQEIINYFRKEGYMVAIHFPNESSSWHASCPLHIQISR